MMKGKIVGFSIIAAILIALCVFVGYHTGGFKAQFKSFYVRCEGSVITTEASGYTLSASADKSLNVDVHYVFKDNESGYSVKVVPNKIDGKDFNFYVNGEVCAYFDVSDLTGGFDIEYKERSFSIKPKGGITEILQCVYPDESVDDCARYSYEDMYSLVISSYDKKDSVVINFTVTESVYGIMLDRGKITF